MGKDFYDRLKDKNLELVLDLKLSHFQRQCHGSNNFIFEKKEFFLRVYKPKIKFRYIIKKGHQKNNVQRDLLACVKDRFNGFEIEI